MFWDRVAGVYDVFVNVINRKTHLKLKEIVSKLIGKNTERFIEKVNAVHLQSKGKTEKRV